MTGPMLHAALRTAADYGDVLPLSTERKPLVAFERASSDPDAIAALWDRFPDAGVGLAAWTQIGPDKWGGRFLVLDIEHSSKGHGDGYATLDELQRTIGALPETRTHATKSGGRHYVFSVPRDAGLRSAHCLIRARGLGAPGVDIITGRSILRWPPTSGYTIVVDGGCAPLPRVWIEALGEAPQEERQAHVHVGESRERRYVLSALEREALELADLAAGRNVALTAAAFRLGRLCPTLHESEIETCLMLACESNGSLREHGQRSCLGTIRRQLRAGAKQPRAIEVRS